MPRPERASTRCLVECLAAAPPPSQLPPSHAPPPPSTTTTTKHTQGPEPLLEGLQNGKALTPPPPPENNPLPTPTPPPTKTHAGPRTATERSRRRWRRAPRHSTNPWLLSWRACAWRTSSFRCDWVIAFQVRGASRTHETVGWGGGERGGAVRVDRWDVNLHTDVGWVGVGGQGMACWLRRIGPGWRRVISCGQA